MTHLETFNQEVKKIYADTETPSGLRVKCLEQLERMTEVSALCSIADSLNVLAGKEVGD